MYDEEALASVVNAIGVPLKVEIPQKNRAYFNESRACVEFNVTLEPITKVWIGFGVDDDTGKEDGFWQEFVYGPMQQYCSVCRHLGHNANKCKQAEKSKENDVVKVNAIMKNLNRALENVEGKEKRVEENMVSHVVQKDYTKRVKEWVPILKSKVVKNVTESDQDINDNPGIHATLEEEMIGALHYSHEGVDMASLGDTVDSDQEDTSDLNELDENLETRSLPNSSESMDDGFSMAGKNKKKMREKKGKNGSSKVISFKAGITPPTLV